MDEEINKHLGIGKEYDFGDKKYVIKPLGLEHYGDSLKLLNGMTKYFQKRKFTQSQLPTSQDILDMLSQDDILMSALSRMIEKTVNTQLLPEADADTKNEFSKNNMFYLIQAVIEQNIPQGNAKDLSKAEKMRQISEKRQNAKSSATDKVE